METKDSANLEEAPAVTRHQVREQMDLPEATSSRNRGLPLDKGPPSIRLHMPSDPNSDLGHRRSLDATVTSKNGLAQPSTASPGDVPSVSPQMAPNVGFKDFLPVG